MGISESLRAYHLCRKGIFARNENSTMCVEQTYIARAYMYGIYVPTRSQCVNRLVVVVCRVSMPFL